MQINYADFSHTNPSFKHKKAAFEGGQRVSFKLCGLGIR